MASKAEKKKGQLGSAAAVPSSKGSGALPAGVE